MDLFTEFESWSTIQCCDSYLLHVRIFKNIVTSLNGWDLRNYIFTEGNQQNCTTQSSSSEASSSIKVESADAASSEPPPAKVAKREEGKRSTFTTREFLLIVPPLIKFRWA